MFDEQSVYWFGDIHRLSLSLCQGHSTTQLMQMIEYQKILPAFLTSMLLFCWEWFCDVLFYTLWREHLCTAALFVSLGCDKMKWNAVSLDYNPWVLVSIFISFFISSYHVLKYLEDGQNFCSNCTAWQAWYWKLQQKLTVTLGGPCFWWKFLLILHDSPFVKVPS